jgi:putative transcriptional regulator
MTRTWILAVIVAVFAPLQGVAQEPGALLVASEGLDDPNFAETVLLLLHHDADGAIAIAINRPTWVSAEQLFPAQTFLHNYRGAIFHGGPVARTNVVTLTRGIQTAGGSSDLLVADIHVSTDFAALEQAVGEARDDARLRFYAGHASWGPGQLDEEIAAGTWKVVEASAERVFSRRPGTLWNELLAAGDETIVHAPPQPETHARARSPVGERPQ